MFRVEQIYVMYDTCNVLKFLQAPRHAQYLEPNHVPGYIKTHPTTCNSVHLTQLTPLTFVYRFHESMSDFVAFFQRFVLCRIESIFGTGWSFFGSATYLVVMVTRLPWQLQGYSNNSFVLSNIESIFGMGIL